MIIDPQGEEKVCFLDVEMKTFRILETPIMNFFVRYLHLVSSKE